MLCFFFFFFFKQNLYVSQHEKYSEKSELFSWHEGNKGGL